MFFIIGFSITVVLVVCTSVIFLLVLFSDLILRCRSCFIGEHVWGYFACGAFLEFMTCACLAFASLNLNEAYVEEHKDHFDKEDTDNGHHHHYNLFVVILSLGIFCLATAICFFYDIFAWVPLTIEKIQTKCFISGYYSKCGWFVDTELIVFAIVSV